MKVVWFVVDTLRSDHLSCYGYFRQTSPAIDKLAQEGVLFEDSYASAIPTGPGFTSLFTGLSAINHGFYLTPWEEPNMPLLDDNIMTLPELIWLRGPYITAAFDNLINFRSHMKQFVRGFEFYTNVTRTPAWLHHHCIGEEVNHRLLPWLEHHADEDFFCFVHYWDPHVPYNHPRKFRGAYDRKKEQLPTRKAPDGYEYVPGWAPVERLPEGRADPGIIGVADISIDLYDEEVRYADYCIAQVLQKLEKLRLMEDTVIIVTSDHGEDLDLHGHWGHASLHETTVRVPLIIRDPKNMPQGKRMSGLVQHTDNLPTILEYFPSTGNPCRPGYEKRLPRVPTSWDGQSLLPVVRGEASAPKEIVLESGEHRAYLAPPWKLIWHKAGALELFHLKNDPLELNDRSEEEPRVRDELEEKLRAWVAQNLRGRRTDPILSVAGAWTCYIGKKEQ